MNTINYDDNLWVEEKKKKKKEEDVDEERVELIDYNYCYIYNAKSEKMKTKPFSLPVCM